jgi:hypothetical protein
MNPDKLFDYLDGTLAAWEREQLEAALVSDEHLQRELAIARQIHKGMNRSREVIVPRQSSTGEEQRGAVLARRIGVAAAVLVALNVAFGLLFIVLRHQKRPPDLDAKEAAVRKQLEESVSRATATQLAVPPIGMSEIALDVPHGQLDAATAEVISAAEHCGGTATKGLPEPTSVPVIVEIPSPRESEFQQAISTIGQIKNAPQVTAPSASTDKKMLQVRINEVAGTTAR